MNKKGETIIDVISFLVMLLMWIVPPIIFAIQGWSGGWWWFAWWVWLAISLGVTELVSKIVTGRTISQHFWRWSAKVDESGKYVNKWKAIGTLALWSIAWGILIVHLGWKLITGKTYSGGDAE